MQVKHASQGSGVILGEQHQPVQKNAHVQIPLGDTC